jgi:hypothetical protein
VSTIDWRKEPPGSAFEMSQEGDYEPTIFLASDSYNRDRRLMANQMDLEYVEVRMETVWYRWRAVDAEEEWRRERCECEHPVGGDDNWCCDPITECRTTEPAESVWDFWDEFGTYCPWESCKRTDEGAVKFRKGVR